MGFLKKSTGWCKQHAMRRVPVIKITMWQTFIILVVIGAGSAAVYSASHKTVAPQTEITANATGSISLNTSNSCGTSCSNSQQPAATTNTSSSSSTSLSPSSKTSTPTPSPAPADTSASEALAKYNQCNSANSAAGAKYSAEIDKAQAAYDQVMGWWNAVKDQPPQLHNPYSEYAAQAKANYNAISVPAWNEYSATVNALKAQGCQIVQTYPNYSW